MTPQTPVNPRPDPEVMGRAADKLKELLGVLLAKAQEAVNAFDEEHLLDDVKALLAPFEPRDQGIVLSALVVETQSRFGDAATVGISGSCAGVEGVGVTATTPDNFKVKACVTGSLQGGIDKGGFEINTIKIP
jgi:hypothetical protein